MNFAKLSQKQSEDEHLLSLYANGDNTAAKILTDRLAPKVLALSMYLLKDSHEAEDVTQEAMLRLWKIAPTWESGRAKVSTWLLKVTKNLCMDRLRKRKTQPIEDAPEQIDSSAYGEETILQKQRQIALLDAIQQLPERQKMAITLRHIKGFSNPEIAEILNNSVEATESLIARAKKNLTITLNPKRHTLGFKND